MKIDFAKLDAENADRVAVLHNKAEDARKAAVTIESEMAAAIKANDTEKYADLFVKKEAYESASKSYLLMASELPKLYSDQDVRACWAEIVAEYDKPFAAAMKKYKAAKTALLDAYIALAKTQNKLLKNREDLSKRLEHGELPKAPKIPAYTREFAFVFKDELEAKGLSTNPTNPCALAFIANDITGGKFVRGFN